MALTLPPVLIGPILRRVEPRFVSVFIATSRAAAVHVTLFDGVVDAINPPPELASADAQTTPFGARFHATVITVALPETKALAAGHRYSYDVRITPEGGSASTLHDLDLLKDSQLPGYGSAPGGQRSTPVDVCSLGYTEGQLPSFVTAPAALDKLVLAHASCRKAHGPGDPALKYIDQLIEGLNGADDGRPHMLFLTGDQIYADDVAAALLPGINTLGIALISGDDDSIEQIVSPSTGGPFNLSSIALPAGFRQKMTGVAGFTSESASCHLIGFGEWLATYCIAWTPQLWPTLAVADTATASLPDALKADLQADAASAPNDAPRVFAHPDPDAANDVLSPLYGGTQAGQDALVDGFESFLPHKQLLDDFRREVPRVRRLLANVPTYMICDDHEVTDDWFMTGGIRTATTTNPFGRALLRNAMAAYTVCQAWGDDPAIWSSDDKRKALLTGISGMFGSGWSGGPPVASACDAVDTALGLSPTGQPQFDFSFTVDGPMHRVRVLDTRTRREYPTPFSSPGLLTQQALDEQLPPTETLPDGHVLVVVSPAPVFGPAVMTELGGPFAANEYDIANFARSETERAFQQDVTGLPNGKPLGAQMYDAEHWGAQPAAFERLLERLSRYKRVVVLAGDVHYAAAYAMDWSGSSRNSRIIHFTSSAAHNAWESVVRNLMLLNGMSVGLQRIGMPMTRLGWKVAEPTVVEDLSSEPPLPRIRILKVPVLLSDDLFRGPHNLKRAPDWIWRAMPILDARPPSDRPTAARAVGVDTELPIGQAAVQHYGDLVAAHVSGLDTVAIARGLQFLNNAGVIRFSNGGDGLHVSQSLYSRRPRPQPNEKADVYIVHDATLEPVSVPVPTHVGPGA